MNHRLTTAPAVEPVTLAEVKEHCRITISDDDALLAPLIRSARQWCETYTGRAFIHQSWTLVLDSFPDELITLPVAPLSSVTSVKYYDSDNAEQTLAVTYYTVVTSAEPGYIELNSGYSWPSVYDRSDAVTIVYVAGYGATASSVDDTIKCAIKIVSADLYDTGRQSTGLVPGSIVSTPAEMLLWPYRVVSF